MAIDYRSIHLSLPAGIKRLSMHAVNHLQRREGGRGAAGVVPAERGPVLLEGRQRQPHVLAARDTPHHPSQPPGIRELQTEN